MLVQEIVHPGPPVLPDPPADPGRAQRFAEFATERVADAVTGDGRHDGHRQHDPDIQHAFMAEVAGHQQRRLAGQDHADQDRGLPEGEPGGDQIQPAANVVAEALQEFGHRTQCAVS